MSINTLPPNDHENLGPQYQIDPDQERILAEDLMHEAIPAAASRFACYRVVGADERSNLGRAVELSVFSRKFGNDAEEMHKEYGPYEAQSDMFVVIDREQVRTAGALRVIHDGPAGLKTLNDVSRPPLNVNPAEFQVRHGVRSLETCWDIGTVAVMPEYRKAGRHVVSALLYRGMHHEAMKGEIEHYVSVIDEPVYQNFRRIGLPFTALNDSEPFSYLGSAKSRAVHGDTSTFVSGVRGQWMRNTVQHPLVAAATAQTALRLGFGVGLDKHLTFAD